MKQKYNLIANELRRQNIRLSHLRKKVLEYLCQNPNHPTVDEIYVKIHKEVPNLSRTTIYNTLHILIKAGLLRLINIEDNETRYDIATQNHGHFKCEECGAIFDFNIDIDSFPIKELTGFKITDKNVYFKGVCPGCLLNIKNDN
ncbi:peroxide stress regulator [Desulfocucumis palustris]|uniref:Peroxide stress regulator n=1 Tax=Desulfocucumis palustris TaxID=1898651 RepID=A0A2L2X7G8_9FIRM|nr:Fur family transcriptional regulator [Desulfocucumis palustris]GBF31940.1 peroxide stress regulator [Desulfocucumis palustris]